MADEELENSEEEEEEITAEMPCPECYALHGVEVEMKEITFVRQYQVSSESVSGTDKFIKIYQCPCCKVVYTQETDTETEVWKKKYKEIMEEYNLQYNNDNSGIDKE